MKILFTFEVTGKISKQYQAVQATDGGYRMEKKGLSAKRFKTCMWCGSYDGLLSHYEAVRWYFGERNVTTMQVRPEA